MKLILIGHDDRYAVEQLLMALFPESQEGEAVSTLHRGSTWITATAKITLNGKTVNFGDAYGTLIKFGNAWLAGHVADMDNVYYSEIDKPLDLLVNDMAKGKWNDFMVGHMAMSFAEPANVNWWESENGYAQWLHSRINQAPGIIRVVNTFGLNHEGVLKAVAAYNAGDETALDAYAAQIVEKYKKEHSL